MKDLIEISDELAEACEKANQFQSMMQMYINVYYSSEENSELLFRVKNYYHQMMNYTFAMATSMFGMIEQVERCSELVDALISKQHAEDERNKKEQVG